MNSDDSHPLPRDTGDYAKLKFSHPDPANAASFHPIVLQQLDLLAGENFLGATESITLPARWDWSRHVQKVTAPEGCCQFECGPKYVRSSAAIEGRPISCQSSIYSAECPMAALVLSMLVLELGLLQP